MPVKVLSELKKGDKARIVKIGGKGPIRRRLLDMGMVAGSEVELQRVAPLGDPVEVKVKGYNLTLRKEEAATVEVEVR
jgi:Fe2+ transport system protein FeoA